MGTIQSIAESGATANPCPCGYYGSTKPCTCLPHAIMKYQHKLSGPILDRIDLYTDVDNIQHNSLLKTNKTTETSKMVHQRVTKARARQHDRYQSASKTNAQLSNRDIKAHARLETAADELLNQAAERLQISARAYMRLVKVARTIADLEGSNSTTPAHISEAIQYRKQTSVL